MLGGGSEGGKEGKTVRLREGKVGREVREIHVRDGG